MKRRLKLLIVMVINILSPSFLRAIPKIQHFVVETGTGQLSTSSHNKNVALKAKYFEFEARIRMLDALSSTIILG